MPLLVSPQSPFVCDVEHVFATLIPVRVGIWRPLATGSIKTDILPYPDIQAISNRTNTLVVGELGNDVMSSC